MPPFTVMTFNIRYGEAADGRHAWPNRRALALETIRDHDPDLLGLQEPTAAQFKAVASALAGRSPFGVATMPDGKRHYDHSGFVRTERFAALDSGVFWLSDTPDVAGSESWGNDWGARACGWVRLRDHASDRELIFACTHLDTNGGTWLPSARVLHAELDKVAAGAPVIVVGDFNCAAGSEAHAYLCGSAGYRDAWTEAGHTDAGVVTFHGFTPTTRLPEAPGSDEWLTGGSEKFAHYPRHVRKHRNCRIDWILVRGPLDCTSATIDCRITADGRMPSDHHPVIASIEWAAG
jgi:endonuclease/exonuclease/phosphatase family metal-dependent hydrolase